jgi:glycosyltransferase involved in cell wall biosynthesis
MLETDTVLAATSGREEIAGQQPVDETSKPIVAPLRILADTHYQQYLEGDCTPLNEEIRRRYPSWVTSATRFVPGLRGALAFWIGKNYDLIVTVNHHPGGVLTLFLERWLNPGKRRVILAEFMTAEGRFLHRLIYPLWFAWIFKPAVRGAMRAGMVMTTAEPEYYAGKFGIRPDRFRCIHLPLNIAVATPRQHEGTDGTVFASGRTMCDWKTLFRAARGASWPLVIVCSKEDLPEVKRLNVDGRATVYSEISEKQHAELMRSASVYALCLSDRLVSSGQIRLRTAVIEGTPIVATAVQGLVGYAIDGTTACTVPPGDFLELRRLIERLLQSPKERAKLMESARSHCGMNDRKHFGNLFRKFVIESANPTQTEDL